jgi:ABC-type dipeptide/oligopeptide/nickel transport system permease subunit
MSKPRARSATRVAHREHIPPNVVPPLIVQATLAVAPP